MCNFHFKILYFTVNWTHGLVLSILSSGYLSPDAIFCSVFYAAYRNHAFCSFMWVFFASAVCCLPCLSLQHLRVHMTLSNNFQWTSILRYYMNERNYTENWEGNHISTSGIKTGMFAAISTPYSHFYILKFTTHELHTEHENQCFPLALYAFDWNKKLKSDSKAAFVFWLYLGYQSYLVVCIMTVF